MSWHITTSTGRAEPFHHTDPPADTGAQVWVRHIPTPALILGSTQPEELVRTQIAADDGIEVCRRRSGGGLVYINPETDCWIDLIIPRTSELWDDDIGRSFHWLGDHWATVVSDLISSDGDTGSPAAVPLVHRHSSRQTPAATVWCFAQLGHGEVSLGGSKIVGLSQRRTRTWLRIQSLVLGAWPGEALRRYVDLDRLLELRADRYGDVEHSMLDPVHVAAGFHGAPHPPAPPSLTERFLRNLPRP